MSLRELSRLVELEGIQIRNFKSFRSRSTTATRGLVRCLIYAKLYEPFKNWAIILGAQGSGQQPGRLSSSALGLFIVPGPSTRKPP